ncbi:large-conductance mechanosensitive channel protein MscL [Algoriphagus sp. D3-2-R+10]|uniref:large-conductance mechanosensitive channel protein MscL n=1 Tax=Algoriphagus aurantiacus TaxID=3103948 RepID=UPI002B3CD2D9|nr:large-conductance mechanosensitive channel protein MscL [Algoriphagus sp. D3-2-R+10]MEB2777120.1 large-conductance mechanosensitive channel protein MscL [Algoriphagus sp. D3-2-R+10]
MGFLKEFKEFAVKGNVIDLAVAVIIGGAFGKIVASFVKDIVMPPIGVLLGGVSFTDLAIVLRESSVGPAGEEQGPVLLTYGIFVQNVVDFVIIALVIFIAVKGINRLKKKEAAAPTPPPPALSKSEVLLEEIRDLLKKDKI